MNRRHFLQCFGAAASVAAWPALAGSAVNAYQRLLILVELKGGNDGLNTVVPHTDPEYARLRPRLALKRDEVLPISDALAFHPALEPLMPLWKSGGLAVIQGVGYPRPNLSHFRSIEIWDTASRSDEYLADGWLARAFAAEPPPASFAADGVIVGSTDLGPLAGHGTRAITLANPEQFLRQAKQVTPTAGAGRSGALSHVLKVEADIANAARRVESAAAMPKLTTEFPKQPFGEVVRTACQVAALSGSGSGVAALRLTLNGFDTHQNQPVTHANLLKQLAEGLVALKAGLDEAGLWQRTLVMTYAEFGRRPKENQSNGTDHGTANVHFALGGRVRGGLYGETPDLKRLDGDGNLGHAVDFRSLYATALERWWSLDSRSLLGGRFAPLERLIA
ncbi:MAG: DUF1501 domain-containing protein [Rhodocyclaceae bacterium]|nr:DUF1501 domain-containing protein [Rhodocyclaceae bacterium]